MAKEPTRPKTLLDPVEALIHIQAIIKTSADLISGTKAEPAMHEITNVLDRALSTRRRRPPTEQ